MRYLSCLILSVLLFWACSTQDNKRPDEVLTRDKMVSILADIHLAEGAVSAAQLEKDTSLFLYRELETELFDKHGISRADFLKSYEWYASHVNEYTELYTIVVDTLNVRTSILK